MAGILFVLVAHTRRGSQCSQDRTCDRYDQLRDKLYSLFLTHNFLLSLMLGTVPKLSLPPKFLIARWLVISRGAGDDAAATA